MRNQTFQNLLYYSVLISNARFHLGFVKIPKKEKERLNSNPMNFLPYRNGFWFDFHRIQGQQMAPEKS